MAGKKQLQPVRFVEDDELAPASVEAPAPLSLVEAIEKNSRLAELLAMRRILATHIQHENTLARDLAPLMRQQREISKEIESLQAVEAERAAADSEDEELDDDDGGAWTPEAI